MESYVIATLATFVLFLVLANQKDCFWYLSAAVLPVAGFIGALLLPAFFAPLAAVVLFVTFPAFIAAGTVAGD